MEDRDNNLHSSNLELDWAISNSTKHRYFVISALNSDTLNALTLTAILASHPKTGWKVKVSLSADCLVTSADV